LSQLIRKLRVLISSPSDVGEERDHLDQAIRDLSSTWGDSLGVVLEPVRFEQNAHPGAASYAQDRINEDIGDDYDIFVGILWTRFGTETPVAESGTEEEFNRACLRWEADNDSVSIMFYFRTSSPGSLDEIDLEQYARVREFQAKLRQANRILYWTYTDLASFDRLVRMHLGTEAQVWRRRFDSKPAATSEIEETSSVAAEPRVPDSGPAEGEEIGLLELHDLATEYFKNGLDALSRIDAYTTELGRRIASRAKDMQASPGLVSRQFRVAANLAALDLTTFCERMEGDIPLLKSNYAEGIDATNRLAEVWTDFGDEGRIVLQNMLEQNKTLSGSIKEASDGMVAFKESTSTVPRVTTALAKARKRATAVIGSMVAELHVEQDLTRESRRIIESLLRDQGGLEA
jgi:Domain of unknown function (DUF4062)